jgi:thioredoxin reductase (NADPH)
MGAQTELAIIGAGPVGLYAAYYAGFRGLSAVVLEATFNIGGQISAFYPESLLFDVPGFPSVRGVELVERLEQQVRQFEIQILLGARVSRLRPFGDGVRLTLEKEELPGEADALDARAVLLAVGIGRLAPQHIADPAIEKWLGHGLTYSLRDFARAAGSELLVVGGTQRGLEIALATAAAGARVTLIHRRERIVAPPALREQLATSAVRFLPFRELAELRGGSRVEHAILVDRRDGSREEIATDLVVPCYAFAATPDDVRGFGLRLDGDAAIVDSRMATSLPRVWAAGDGATYPGKVRVLAAEFGEACTAINNLTAGIRPGAPVFPGFSSHRARKLGRM